MPLLPPDKTDTALAGSVPAAAVQQNGDVALAGLVPAAAAQQEGGVALAGFDATAVATATADNPTPDTERNEDPTKFGPATSISQKLLANLGWQEQEGLVAEVRGLEQDLGEPQLGRVRTPSPPPTTPATGSEEAALAATLTTLRKYNEVLARRVNALRAALAPRKKA
ncbi:hypothetical protein HDU90_006916 [Geranomyces variabilis]|nr:hypothetical protein HDU90_006916 [Geranomyces variabilis]